MKIVKFQHETASAHLTYVDRRVVVLNNLWAEERGSGHATGLLNEIIGYADAKQLTILLVAQRYGNPNRSALNNTQLEQFYAKFGFEQHGTQKRPVMMRREPNSQKIHAA